MEKNRIHPVKVGKGVRMSFARQKEVLEMPNLIEVQTNSYQWFLDEGLKEVFRDISLLVMRLQLVGSLDDFVVQLVLHVRFDRNHDGLVHLIRDDGTNPGFAESSGIFTHVRLPPLLGLVLTNNSFDAGNVFLDNSNLQGVIQLIGRMLHSQHEQILLQLSQLAFQLSGGHFTDFVCLHLIHHHSRFPGLLWQ